MGFESNYIKDIEQCFLRLKGRGVMLSSRDYTTIQEWEERKIPKETVMDAITDAFRHHPHDIRNLQSCKPYVENFHKRTKHKTRNFTSNRSDQREHLRNIIRKIDKLLEDEKREILRNHYIKYRSSLKELMFSNESGEIYETLGKLENNFFDTFFESLAEKEKHALNKETNRIIPSDSGFLNEEVRNDTFKAFRNEILQKRYKLVNVFEYD